MRHIDIGSVSLCGFSSILGAISGTGVLQALTAISILTTIIYNVVKTRNEIKNRR